MSQELKELREYLERRFDRVDSGFGSIKDRVVEVEKVALTNTRESHQLSRRLSKTDTRLDEHERVITMVKGVGAFLAVVALVVAIITGLTKAGVVRLGADEAPMSKPKRGAPSP